MKFKIYYLTFVLFLLGNTFLTAQNSNYKADWVNQYGTNGGKNIGNNIVADSLGNYYLSGKFGGESELGGVMFPYGGNFVAKFNQYHQVSWVKKIDDVETIDDLVISNAGKIFFSGYATQNTMIDTFSVNQGAFISKIDTNGNVIWVDNVVGNKISLAVDNMENLYLTGRGDIGGNGIGILVEKRDVNKNIVWTNTYGSINSHILEYGRDIAVSDSSLYIGGTLKSLALNVGNGIQILLGSSYASFFININPNTGLSTWGKALNNGALADIKTSSLGEAILAVYSSADNIFINSGINNYNSGLLKFNSLGSVIGNYSQYASHINVDKYDNIYLVSDLLSKIDSSGSTLWSSTQIVYYDASDFLVKKSGKILITGGIGLSNYFFGTLDTLQFYKGYVLEFDTLGNPLSSLQFGNNGGNMSMIDMAQDTSNNIIVLGISTATIQFDNDTIYPHFDQNNSLFASTFIKKLSSGGSVLWIRQINNSDASSAYSTPVKVKTDISGNIYITGVLSGTITFHDGTQLTGTHDAYIAKYSSTGNLLWAEMGQGSRPKDFIIDALGALYLVGDKYNYLTLKYDAHIEKFNSFNGVNLGTETLGGSEDGVITNIIALNDVYNSIYIIGEFKSPSLTYNGNNIVVNQSAGGKDIFLIDITGNFPFLYLPSGNSIGGIGDEEVVDVVVRETIPNNKEIVILGKYYSPIVTFSSGISINYPNLNGGYGYGIKSQFIASYQGIYTNAVRRIHNNPSGGGSAKSLSITPQNEVNINILYGAQIEINGSWHQISSHINNNNSINLITYEYQPNVVGNQFLLGRTNYYDNFQSLILNNRDYILGISMRFNRDSIIIDNNSLVNIGERDYFTNGHSDYVISRLRKNYYPDTLTLTNNAVYENQSPYTFIGNLTTIDQNNLDTFSYSSVNGTGDIHNSLFYISNDSLFTDTTFNYEVQNTYSIRVQTDDGNGGTFEMPMTISISDTNDVPTNLMAIDTIIAENQPLGAMVGLLSTTDEDVADNHIYSLIAGTGDTDNGLFSISNDTLKAQTTFDFEMQNTSYSIRVKTDDGNSGIYERVFTIIIQDINDIPDTFQLSNNIVAENQPIGTVVGILSTTDQDVSDIHTYSLVTGTGDIDNSKFSVSGTGLETAIILDFEAQNSYSIRLQTNDGNGGVLQQVVVITATDNNDIPILISSTDTTVTENQPTGTVVGTLSTTDQDVSDVHTYSLVTGTGDTDNSKFNINGTDLETATILDFEAQNSYSIRIKTDDGNGGFLEQIFTILATDNNDVPILVSSTDTTIAENQVIGTVVGTLSTTDQDVSDVHTYSLVTGTGAIDNTQFSINGNNLETATILDYETQNSFSIRIKTDDGNGGILEQIFTILATDNNDVPSQLNMTDTAIVENVHVGEFVTLLSTIDQDISDVHSYSFVSGFGDTDNNDFFVTVDSLFSNVEFDFEAKNSYSIRLQTDDGNGGTLQKAFLINVIDITQEPVNTMNQLDVESLRLFPNPTNNILIIEVNLATSKKNVSIDLTDVLGQQIWKNIEETNVQNLKHQFDVSEIPAGTYFLRILADGQVLTKKVIVQH
jgi:hypothetical protein